VDCAQITRLRVVFGGPAAVLAQLRGIGLQRLVDSPVVDTERLRHAVTEYWRRALALPLPPA